MTSKQKPHGSTRLKAFLIVFIFILAGVVAAVFVNYRQSMKQATRPDSPEQTTAALSISDFEHTAIKNGETEWTLKADLARLYSETQKVMLTRLETIFFMDTGGRVVLNADRGEMDMVSKNIRAHENVIVSHPDYILETESLNYQYDSRIIVIETPLVITGDAIVFSADSGRYEMDEKKATFEGNIEGWLGKEIVDP